MKPILIFGHKNPDTDSICSALSLTKLKELQGIDAKACRLGDVSKETQFVLDRFKLEAPTLLTRVDAQLSNLTDIEKTKVEANASLKKIIDTMKEKTLEKIVIVNEDSSFKGIITFSEIVTSYVSMHFPIVFRDFYVSFENLKETLSATLIAGEYPTGKIDTDLKILSDDIEDTSFSNSIVITTSLKDVSNLEKAKMIILCPDKKEIVLPEKFNIPILKVDTDINDTIQMIFQSVSISSLLSKDEYRVFSMTDYISDVKNEISNSSQDIFPIIDSDNKVVGSFEAKNLNSFEKNRVILVDHNESTQSADGRKDATIIQVVDHHRFANFETSEPVKINADIVGCTCTIVYDLYKEAGIVPPKEIAGLMMSAILSDTLIFNSPTCTDKDIAAVNALSEISGITNFKEYGMELLIAGTPLTDKTPEEILGIDQKEFDMNSLKLSISQVNTVDVNLVLKQQDAFEKAMEKKNKENNYNLSILIITDIIKSGSSLLVVGDSKLVEEAFGVTLKNNSVWIDGVVSRKKQVVPFLMSASERV